MTKPKPSRRLPFFSRRMRQLREAAGLSLYALARRVGVTDQALANIERGAVPSLPTALAIAEALKVPFAGELAGESAQKNSEKYAQPGLTNQSD